MKNCFHCFTPGGGGGVQSAGDGLVCGCTTPVRFLPLHSLILLNRQESQSGPQLQHLRADMEVLVAGLELEPPPSAPPTGSICRPPCFLSEDFHPRPSPPFWSLISSHPAPTINDADPVESPRGVRSPNSSCRQDGWRDSQRPAAQHIVSECAFDLFGPACGPLAISGEPALCCSNWGKSVK